VPTAVETKALVHLIELIRYIIAEKRKAAALYKNAALRWQRWFDWQQIQTSRKEGTISQPNERWTIIYVVKIETKTILSISPTRRVSICRFRSTTYKMETDADEENNGDKMNNKHYCW